MALTAAQQAKLNAWTVAHPLKPCANCAASKWEFGPDVYFLHAVRDRNLVHDEGLALLPALCGNCACVVYLGASKIGLV